MRVCGRRTNCGACRTAARGLRECGPRGASPGAGRTVGRAGRARQREPAAPGPVPGGVVPGGGSAAPPDGASPTSAPPRGTRCRGRERCRWRPRAAFPRRRTQGPARAPSGFRCARCGRRPATAPLRRTASSRRARRRHPHLGVGVPAPAGACPFGLQVQRGPAVAKDAPERETLARLEAEVGMDSGGSGLHRGPKRCRPQYRYYSAWRNSKIFRFIFVVRKIIRFGSGSRPHSSRLKRSSSVEERAAGQRIGRCRSRGVRNGASTPTPHSSEPAMPFRFPLLAAALLLPSASSADDGKAFRAPPSAARPAAARSCAFDRCLRSQGAAGSRTRQRRGDPAGPPRNPRPRNSRRLRDRLLRDRSGRPEPAGRRRRRDRRGLHRRSACPLR